MGLLEEAKGRLKQAFGDLTGNPKVQKEGEAQSEKGRAEREATEARMRARAQESKARAHETEQGQAEQRKAERPR